MIIAVNNDACGGGGNYRYRGGRLEVNLVSMHVCPGNIDLLLPMTQKEFVDRQEANVQPTNTSEWNRKVSTAIVVHGIISGVLIFSMV